MKNKLTWFYTLDKKIWGDNIDTNPYLGTLSLMFAALMGAIFGGAEALNGLFEWGTVGNLIQCISLLVYIWSINVVESVVASANWKVAALRILLLLLGLVLMYLIGVGMALLVIGVVILWLVLVLGTGALKGALSSSSSSGKKYTLEDGTEVEKEVGLLGEVSYKEKYGSRRFEETGYNSGEVREL